MTKRPKRVAIIGFDCAIPKMIQKHIDEGFLPNFKKVMENGVVAENCLGAYPTITPPNWTTIATGACPGTHGITDFWLNKPNTTPTDYNIEQAYDSEKVQAEFVWDALDKVGKKCVVLNYPVSWPSHMKNGVVIGGTGLAIGDDRNGFWNLEYQERAGQDKHLTTQDSPMSIKGAFKSAEGWANAAAFGSDLLELEARLSSVRAKFKPADLTCYVLAGKAGKNGYDRIALCPSKDLNAAFCILSVGQWSPKIFTHIKMENGEEWEVYFRAKLLELSADAGKFRLYLTTFTPLAKAYLTGVSSHPEILEQIERSCSDDAIMTSVAGTPGIVAGWYDFDTYLETIGFHDQWLAEAAGFLLRDKDWDLFCMHSHPIDWAYHIFMNKLDPSLTPDPTERERFWSIHRRIHQAQDKLLGNLMEILGEDTLVVVLSDHGATPDGPYFSPHDPLKKAGLTVFKDESSKALGKEFGRFGQQYPWYSIEPDAARSKAIPNRMCNVYVNLKGRFPNGIVEPEDYEKVQEQIIDAFYTYIDPISGKRPISLALTKKDARILGLFGDNIGDVIYAVYPTFGSMQHGPNLQTSEYSVGSVGPVFMVCGPGVREGQRLARTIWLTDVVPTICYLMDWPLPEQAEGAVIYQAFEDPNFKMKQIRQLQEAIGCGEEALARKNRKSDEV